MNAYVIEGSWLRKKLGEITTGLNRIKRMRKDGKRKDENGLSLANQEIKLRVEIGLLKEILNHATDADWKKKK